MSALLPRNSGRCARSTAPQLLPTPPLAAATPKRPPSRSGRSEAIAQALARRGRPGRGGACVEGRPLGRWAEGRGQGWGRRNFLRLRLGSGLQSRLRLVSQSLRTGLVGCEVQPHRYQCGPAPGCPAPRGDLPELRDPTGKSEGSRERPDGKGVSAETPPYTFCDKHSFISRVL